MYSTIYLDPDSWDLALTIAGDIAVADAPYSIAQDVASSCRLWRGEYIYNTPRGIPYEESVLGQMPPRNIFASWLEREAKTVPSVLTATPILLYNAVDRSASGQIQIKLTDGTTSVIGI